MLTELDFKDIFFKSFFNSYLMPSKSQLAIQLSKLKVFDKENVHEISEQYPTDSETAASLLWNAHMLGDIENKSVADLGAGTGILGIGSILLGAKKVYFVEKDENAIKILKENLCLLDCSNYQVIHSDISSFNKKINTVIMNPPFGTREKHADKNFLSKAFEIADVIYSIHLAISKDFLKKFSQDNNKKITHSWDFEIQLKQTLKHHKRKVHRTKVVAVRMNSKC